MPSPVDPSVRSDFASGLEVAPVSLSAPASDGPSDVELMTGIQAGDPDALSQLYDRYNGIVKALVLRILHNDTEADDLLQEVFLRAHQTIGGLNRAVKGAIRLSGAQVTSLKPSQRGIGYVPQDRALFSTMSVYENLAFALRVRERRPGVIGALALAVSLEMAAWSRARVCGFILAG